MMVAGIEPQAVLGYDLRHAEPLGNRKVVGQEGMFLMYGVDIRLDVSRDRRIVYLSLSFPTITSQSIP